MAPTCGQVKGNSARQSYQEERFMQEEVVRTEAFAEVEAGRKSENVCPLAQFFNGFANLTGSYTTASGAPYAMGRRPRADLEGGRGPGSSVRSCASQS